MGLFDKKYCDVCGEKIGFLGNRKLEDANLCKNCAAKLSPWFNERRHSTLEEIKDQLKYRDENLERVRQFHTTRSYGKGTKLLIDEDAKAFVITSARDLVEANPDVVEFSQVTGCTTEIYELKREQKTKDAEGKSVSYNPPRYEYAYDFTLRVQVNTPFFDEMYMRLNTSEVKTGNRSMKSGAQQPKVPTGGIMGILTGAGADKLGSDSAPAEYMEYVRMGEEIREVLMEERAKAREELAEPSDEGQAVICPFCMASTIPDKNGRCEYCGGPLNS